MEMCLSAEQLALLAYPSAMLSSNVNIHWHCPVLGHCNVVSSFPFEWEEHRVSGFLVNVDGRTLCLLPPSIWHRNPIRVVLFLVAYVASHSHSCGAVPCAMVVVSNFVFESSCFAFMLTCLMMVVRLALCVFSDPLVSCVFWNAGAIFCAFENRSRAFTSHLVGCWCW